MPYSFKFGSDLIESSILVEDFDSGTFMITVKNSSKEFFSLNRRLIETFNLMRNNSFATLAEVDHKDIVIHYTTELTKDVHSIAQDAYVFKRTYNAGDWDFYFKCKKYASERGFYMKE